MLSFNYSDNAVIFKDFFERRPEIKLDQFQNDLKHYYLPYLERIIATHKQKLSKEALIIGVSAIQGTGKSTQGEILEILLKFFGYSSVHLSIDDHYLTHEELNTLRTNDPRYIRRGVTHDINLALRNLIDLKTMREDRPVLISGYDKSAHLGDGDRFAFIEPIEGLIQHFKIDGNYFHLTSAEYNKVPLKLPPNMGAPFEIDLTHRYSGYELNLTMSGDHAFLSTAKHNFSLHKSSLPMGWRLITQAPNFVFYDGWMLGAKQVKDESVFLANLPALETEEARQFARDVNHKLADYQPLWELIDFLNVLYVPNYQISIKWRDQAEEALRAKGSGMTHEQIVEFVHYFWRSVHPAIQIKNLAEDPRHIQQLTIINDDHAIQSTAFSDSGQFHPFSSR